MTGQTLPTKNDLKKQDQDRKEIEWENLVPVTCVVEKCGKIVDDDSYFFTELRILTGQHRGSKADKRWSRQWKSGDWKEETIEFLRALCPKEADSGNPVWSYMLQDKCFKMTPFKTSKGYWNFKDFKLGQVPAEDAKDFATQSVESSIDDIPF